MENVTLGGRAFKVIDFDARTVMMDHYLMKWTRATSVDKVMPSAEEVKESTQAYLMRVQTCLIESLLVPELLGGYLLPEGTTEAQWTPAVARKTAEFIKQLNTDEDRELIVDLAMQVAFGFFRRGLNSLRRFQSFSASKSLETRGTIQ